MESNLFRKGETVEKYYKLTDTLGEGSFSVVMKAIKKKTGQEFAAKIIDRSKLTSEETMALKNEIEILCQIDHPNVVKLFEIFEDKDLIYLIMEYMSGGELFDRIVEREHYSEKEASDTIRPVIDCIKYCHSLGIVHRDLKPENLLYTSKNADSILKISDFGLARFFDSTLMKTSCGTPGYVAPEILIGTGYSSSVDCWSLGIIIYIMLCGSPPFYSENNDDLYEQIKKGKFDFPSPIWDDISDLAKDLIKRILVVNPDKRLKADEILLHPWILGDKTPRITLPKATANLKVFNIKRKVKRAAIVLIAAKKLELATGKLNPK